MITHCTVVFEVKNVYFCCFNREKVPFVSSTPHSKLILRAVKLNDSKLLQQLINDVSNVALVSVDRFN
jgi:hypothetical protein